MKKNLALFSIVLTLIVFPGFINCQVWIREFPDSTGISKGWFTSLKIDQNDKAHVVYYDDDFADLRYSTNKSGSWEITKVDTSEFAGLGCSLTLDGDGNPHICYGVSAYLETESGLMHSYYSNGSWVKETILNMPLVAIHLGSVYISAEFSPDDILCAAYSNVFTKDICLATKVDDNWDIETVSLNTSCYYIKLFFKSDGTPVIWTFTGDNMTLFSKINDSWERFDIPVYPIYAIYNMQSADAAMDSDGNIHIVCTSLENLKYETQYIFYDWDQYQKTNINENITYVNAIAVSPDNTPYIITDESGLMLYKKEESGWTSELIDDDLSLGYFISVNFNSLNYPCIAPQGIPVDSPNEKDYFQCYYSFYEQSPTIQLSNNPIEFGPVWTESYSIEQCWIRNVGQAPLTLSAIATPNVNLFSAINANFPMNIDVDDSIAIDIRFKPLTTKEYYEELIVHSNDINHPQTALIVTGEGISEGNESSLKVLVNDQYLDEEYLALYNDIPAKDVAITLLQNQEIVAGPQMCLNDGSQLFESLNPGNYTILLSKDLELPWGGNETLNKYINIEIGPGKNTNQVVFADSLFRYKLALIDKMEHIEKEGFGVLDEFSYEVSEEGVKQLMSKWGLSLTDQKAECLARLILAESMTYDLFSDGYVLGNEMMSCFGDLIGFIYYSNDWATDLIEILKAAAKTVQGTGARELFDVIMQTLMKELIKYEIIKSITQTIKLIGAEIGTPADTLLLDAWNAVKAKYGGFPHTGIGFAGWNSIQRLVYDILRDPFFQGVYINLQTGPNITKAKNYSESFNFNGDLTEAFGDKIDFVADKKHMVEMIHSISSDLRTNADLLFVTSILLDWVSALDPTGISSILDDISFYMKLGAYAEVATALGMSTTVYFILPEQMEDAVVDIYFPNGKPAPSMKKAGPMAIKHMPMSITQKSALLSKLETSVDNYNHVLNQIKININNDQFIDATSLLPDLRESELEMDNALTNTLYPVMAVAKEAHDSITGFYVQYDSLISYQIKAAQERLITYFKVYSLGIENDPQYKSIVIDQIDFAMQQNDLYSSQVTDVFETTSSEFDLPCMVVTSQNNQSAITLKENDEAEVSIQLQNISAIDAENVYIKFKTSEGLVNNSLDSIYIGNLAAGKTSQTINWNVKLTDDNVIGVVWFTELFSDNAKTYPADGSFNVESETQTFLNKNSSEPEWLLFPVPANDFIYIKCNDLNQEPAKIFLTDLKGQTILNSTINANKITNDLYRIQLNEVPTGVYMIKIVNQYKTVVNQKIQVIKKHP